MDTHSGGRIGDDQSFVSKSMETLSVECLKYCFKERISYGSQEPFPCNNPTVFKGRSPSPATIRRCLKVSSFAVAKSI